MGWDGCVALRFFLWTFSFWPKSYQTHIFLGLLNLALLQALAKYRRKERIHHFELGL